jgi:hypothetical protein
MPRHGARLAVADALAVRRNAQELPTWLGLHNNGLTAQAVWTLELCTRSRHKPTRCLIFFIFHFTLDFGLWMLDFRGRVCAYVFIG